MTIRIITLFIPLFLAGCLTKSPGEQCLDSFRMDLKDPDSGKVISFTESSLTDSKLTYSATNTYGARIQKNALCAIVNGKWERARDLERITAYNLSTEKLNASTNCMNSGGKIEECASGSNEIRRSHILKRTVDIDLMLKESMDELGFN